MKFSGMIGFELERVEDPDRPSVYRPQMIEKNYKGDVLNRTSRWQQSDIAVDDNLNVSNRISVVSNKFLDDNLSSMKYIVFKGVAWKINSITLQPPRLILEMGGVYNGERPE